MQNAGVPLGSAFSFSCANHVLHSWTSFDRRLREIKCPGDFMAGGQKGA